MVPLLGRCCNLTCRDISILQSGHYKYAGTFAFVELRSDLSRHIGIFVVEDMDGAKALDVVEVLRAGGNYVVASWIALLPTAEPPP